MEFDSQANRIPTEERWKVEVIDHLRKEQKIKPYTKIVVSGNVLEVYQYDKPPTKPERDMDAEKAETSVEWIADMLKEDRTLERRKQTTREARNTVRRIVLSNFDNGSKFITLTFRDGSVNDVKDVRECNKEFKKFIQRLRYRYKDFKYIAVIEFQDKNGRGAVHYHMMSDLPYIPHKELEEIWSNGFVGINDIGHVDNVGAYMVKYMLKNIEDERLVGLKCYLTSKGLERPREYKGKEAEAIIQAYQLHEKNMVYCGSYPTEYQDICTYKEYNLLRL